MFLPLYITLPAVAASGVGSYVLAGWVAKLIIGGYARRNGMTPYDPNGWWLKYLTRKGANL